MTAPWRQQVLVRILVHAAADALPAVLSWLRESPATFEQLLEAARVAQAWDRAAHDGEKSWTRWPRFALLTRTGQAPDVESVCHVSQRTDGLWEGFVLGFRLDDTFATPEEARDATDAEARGLGWTLLAVPHIHGGAA